MVWWEWVNANALPRQFQSAQNDPRWGPWMEIKHPIRQHIIKRHYLNYTGFSPIFEASRPHMCLGVNYPDVEESQTKAQMVPTWFHITQGVPRYEK